MYNRIQIDIEPRTLHFKQPAGTSRGTMLTRRSWFLGLRHAGQPGCTGRGECAPLPRLSCDDVPRYEETLRHICHQAEEILSTALCPGHTSSARTANQPPCPPNGAWLPTPLLELTEDFPSIRFGLETAWANLLAGGKWQLWNTPFSRGEAGITTNGLIWMGTFEEMQARIHEKMSQGFHCIKLKIGSIDFEHELSLLQAIRSRFSPDEVELRVDANGAFAPTDAPDKLRRLAALGLHSIEQPIRAGQWQEMAALCRTSPLAIALDEELIGVNRTADKTRLLDTIRPAYIILKPSLHGGLTGAMEWIRLAQTRGIGYWVTSALESNVGLNAIAQWTATLQPALPQGLGTGQLFTDNIDSPLHMEGECLWFRP